MARKRIILILGMGRSGSSALAGFMSLCGAILPERLLGANPGNPKGHWEPLDALELNERILGAHGSSWFDPSFRLQGADAFNEAERRGYFGHIQGFVDELPGVGPFVIKEPRITSLCGLWLESLRLADIDVRIAIPVRHPNEVAASLATRDRTPRNLSMMLWLKYNLIAERCSRRLPRIFIQHPAWMNNWRSELRRINETLALDLQSPKPGEAEDFLTMDLYRERLNQLDDGCPASVLHVYESLIAAATEDSVNTRLMDDLFEAVLLCEEQFIATSASIGQAAPRRVRGDPDGLKEVIKATAWAADYVYWPGGDPGVDLAAAHVMSCLYATDETGRTTLRLAGGEWDAPSGGKTGGLSIRVPDAFERTASGGMVRIRVIARSKDGEGRLALAYSTNEVGNSGWRWFDVTSAWSILDMRYRVPPMKAGRGDFIGLLPGPPETSAIEVCLVAAIALGAGDVG